MIVFFFLCALFVSSASTSNVAKLEEMERLLREAQAEKNRLLEYKVIIKSPSQPVVDGQHGIQQA